MSRIAQWFRNDTDTGLTGPRVEPGETTRGEHWRVCVTANDGSGAVLRGPRRLGRARACRRGPSADMTGRATSVRVRESSSMFGELETSTVHADCAANYNRDACARNPTRIRSGTMLGSRRDCAAPRRAHRWLVWVVVFAIFPSATTIAVDTVSLILQGQTLDEAHAAEVASEVDADCAEHGCSGLVHNCECCASPSVIPAVTTADLGIPPPTPVRLRASAARTRASDGFPAELFRPPLA